MIINVRGTSGSGKSHLVRHIMSQFTAAEPFHVEGRKRPLWYHCFQLGDVANPVQELAILGHYETPCGGCDTIKTLDEIYALAREKHLLGMNVLFEGLLINSDRNRLIQMHEDGLPLMVVTINEPLKVCLASIEDRREVRRSQAQPRPIRWERKTVGHYIPDPKPLNPRNTETKWKLAKVNHEKFLEAGVLSYFVDRDEATKVVEEVLGL